MVIDCDKNGQAVPGPPRAGRCHFRLPSQHSAGVLDRQCGLPRCQGSVAMARTSGASGSSTGPGRCGPDDDRGKGFTMHAVPPTACSHMSRITRPTSVKNRPIQSR